MIRNCPSNIVSWRLTCLACCRVCGSSACSHSRCSSCRSYRQTASTSELSTNRKHPQVQFSSRRSRRSTPIDSDLLGHSMRFAFAWHVHSVIEAHDSCDSVVAAALFTSDIRVPSLCSTQWPPFVKLDYYIHAICKTREEIGTYNNCPSNRHSVGAAYSLTVTPPTLTRVNIARGAAATTARVSERILTTGSCIGEDAHPANQPQDLMLLKHPNAPQLDDACGEGLVLMFKKSCNCETVPHGIGAVGH